MLLLGENSLREVIAFPKIKDASCPMTGAPDFVDQKQLDDLKLGVGAAEEAKREHAEKITRETVQNTALLSMLSLSASDEKALDRDFSGIVDFAGELAALDRQAPPPPRIRNEKSVNVRPDETGASFPLSHVLMNAKTVSGPYITVPKTFE